MQINDIVKIKFADMSLMWPTSGTKKYLSSGKIGIIVSHGKIGWTNEPWWTVLIEGESWQVHGDALQYLEKLP